MPATWTGSSGHSKSSKNKTAYECTAATDSPIHQNILILLELRTVILYIARSVFYIRSDNCHITPTKIFVIDMIGAVISKHLTPPCQGLIRFVPIHHHTKVPCAQIFKCGIKFTVQVGLFIMMVSLNRINCFRGIYISFWIRLGQGDRVFKRNSKGKSL